MSPEEYMQYERQRRGQAPAPQEPEPTAKLGPEDRSDPTWYQKTGRFMYENLDIPVGLAGAIYGGFAGAAGGAKAGAPGGPKGVLAGTIVGGAIGTAAGSLMSDTLQGEQADYYEAMQQAAISMGVDVATFGAWTKGIKPAWVATRESLGYTPKESVEAVMQAAKLGQEAGSRESLLATQNILAQGGASLTPFQAGATGFKVVGQRIAEVGIGSSRIMQENAVAVNTAARSGLEDIMSKAAAGVEVDASSLGQALFGGIDAGRKAMIATYGAGLDQIQRELATVMVPTQSLRKSLLDFKKSRAFGGAVQPTPDGTVVRGATDFEIDSNALRFIDEQLDFLTSNKVIKASDLLLFEKNLNSQLSNFTDIATYNSAGARDLTEISKLTKGVLGDIFEKANPEVAAKYAALKSEYHKSMDGLLPPLTKSFVQGAKEKQHYQALGEILTKSGDIDEVAKMFTSLDEAYRLIPADGLTSLPFKSTTEAKEVIKKSYLRHLFPTIGEPISQGQRVIDPFSVNDYAHLARQFGDPTEAARLKLIMGDDYLRTKQLINLMYEASQRPTSNIGELVLKSKEYAAAATIYGAASVGGVASGGATAAVILIGPVMLARASTNPKAMAKLIAFDKKKFATSDAMELAAANLAFDIMRELPEDEQGEVRGEIMRLSTMQEEKQRAYNEALKQMQIQSKAAEQQQRVQQQPMP